MALTDWLDALTHRLIHQKQPGLSTVPIGMLSHFPGAMPDSSWLVCDGGSFSAATYPQLAAYLGGTTLPDYRGKVLVMQDAGQAEFDVIGETGGSKSSVAQHNHSHSHGALGVTASGGQSQQHYHLPSGGSGYYLVSPQQPQGGANVTTGGGGHGIASSSDWNAQDHTHNLNHTHATDATNTGVATNGNLPPYTVTNIGIKAL